MVCPPLGVTRSFLLGDMEGLAFWGIEGHTIVETPFPQIDTATI